MASVVSAGSDASGVKRPQKICWASGCGAAFGAGTGAGTGAGAIGCAGCGAARPYPKVEAPPNFEGKCFNDHYEKNFATGLCELKEK